ncbi:hypothetical protein [Microbulbifer sp.]|uniref:hypothetical protein n=1 Tax=Microbulbifer sp. TaxID=1908541 RepID=UPI003F38FB0B
MKKLLLITLALPLAATAADPMSTSCTHGDDVRTIEVVYPQGAELPCEVHYTKDGETRTLWSASNQAGFCESKAEEFISKQQNWGWQCDSAADEPQENTAAMEPAPAAESADLKTAANGEETPIEAQTD